MHTFFTINIRYKTITGEFWAPYGGPSWWQYDWWVVPSARFESEESAMNVIKSDSKFKNCLWEIVKTTVTEEIVKERQLLTDAGVEGIVEEVNDEQSRYG